MSLDDDAQALLDWFTPEQAAKRRDEMAAATRARTAVHFECARCPEQFEQLKELKEHSAVHRITARQRTLTLTEAGRAAIKGRTG